ncbi:MAG: peptide-methionine (S)-S-oxide reductase MsrA [Chlamydiota bacterium]
MEGSSIPKKRGQVFKKATFAAGCFWGIEAKFRKIKGVKETRVGYTGGTLKNPTYEQVCTGKTGHAEAVEILFDPSKVTYDALLDSFWQMHDPTSWHKQGPDIGSQYRSAIFYHTSHQKEAACKSKEAEEKMGRLIVTEIVAIGPFYEAEKYHQRYLEKQNGHCGI